MLIDSPFPEAIVQRLSILARSPEPTKTKIAFLPNTRKGWKIVSNLN